jgi:DNA-binding NarL/FixJ family response regulator
MPKSGDIIDDTVISFLNNIISKRITSGVVVINETNEILYLNQEAQSILSTFNADNVSSDKNPADISKAIVDSIRESLGSLTDTASACIHCNNSNNTYALRAIPLHQPNQKGKRCILVLIEGITIQHKFDLKAVQKKFGLTKRETEVTFCLTKGLTNKEIANTLSLSPETVHDYVKQIMKKLKTTTRAGIVGTILP